MILDHTRFVLKQDLQDVWHYMVKDDERQAVIAKKSLTWVSTGN